MKVDDCIFCQIVAGEIPSTKVYETENILGFKDLNPQVKEHYLFIHKDHTKNMNEMVSTEPQQLVELFSAIQKFTSANDLEKDGFRMMINTNKNGNQTVFHTHVHLLGGEPLPAF